MKLHTTPLAQRHVTSCGLCLLLADPLPLPPRGRSCCWLSHCHWLQINRTFLFLLRSQKLEAASSTCQEIERNRRIQKEFQEAVNRRDRAEINRLLSNGVNINALNEAGDTPLHQCIRDGRIESAKLLVEFGADVTRTNRDGWSPAHLATSLGHRQLLLYLIMNSNGKWKANQQSPEKLD